MKKRNECLEKSAAYKSRTDPPQYFVLVSLKGKELEDTIERNGIVYDKTDHIPIDLDAIPNHAREALARATLEYYRQLIKEPGMTERLNSMTAARKNRKN